MVSKKNISLLDIQRSDVDRDGERKAERERQRDGESKRNGNIVGKPFELL